jgi:hypothetical protein
MKIEDVIAAASEELNASYENNALWFEVLIHQAVRSHKTPKKFKEIHVRVEAQDNKIVMPDGWIRILGLYDCNTSLKYCPDIDYVLQNDCIVFDTGLAIKDGTKFDFRYYGLNINDQGELIIPDDWERMLVAYIGWKYTRRYIKDFGVAVMQNYQREYQTQKLANV